MGHRDILILEAKILVEKYKKEELPERIAEYIDKNFCRRQEIFGENAKTSARKTRLLLATPERIVDIVLAHFHTTMEEVSRKTREREVVYVRHICMFLLNRYTRLSLKNIGRAFGGQDHTTVLHATQAIQDRMDTDRAVCTEVVNLIRTIKTEVLKEKKS